MDISACMVKLLPSAQWSCGETYASIVMTDATPKPSLADLEAAWVLVQADRAQAATDEAAAQADRQQVKALLTALVAGSGTVAERAARCERVLARLIKDIYK